MSAATPSSGPAGPRRRVLHVVGTPVTDQKVDSRPPIDWRALLAFLAVLAAVGMVALYAATAVYLRHTP